ncbi:cytidine deaminase family protein [Luteolibacter luteus]|uniref:Cytidine deaminase n=1 Tax=Luteolibacter luteus TaxID=2728835 RepID=A0A858RLD5_9BACT|nr:cytidine deaminase [Luteolibacter luteus]QJE96813.1 cytidine deaminase [Luteolibacter luteus]
MNPEHQQLIDAARPLVRNLSLGRPDWDAASVAAAIRTPAGNIYTGICIHLSCGLGFCAEHAASAEMIKAGETQIEAIVAVTEDSILAPCGRCREFLLQVNPRNADATVILNGGRLVKLRELMPEHWLVSMSREA